MKKCSLGAGGAADEPGGADLPGAPAGHGGLQVDVQRAARHRLVRAQLLLQARAHLARGSLALCPVPGMRRSGPRRSGPRRSALSPAGISGCSDAQKASGGGCPAVGMPAHDRTLARCAAWGTACSQACESGSRAATTPQGVCVARRCGNVAAILELDEHLNKSFKVGAPVRLHTPLQAKGLCWHCNLCVGASLSQTHLFLQVFEAAPQDMRGVPAKKVMPNYFL